MAAPASEFRSRTNYDDGKPIERHESLTTEFDAFDQTSLEGRKDEQAPNDLRNKATLRIVDSPRSLFSGAKSEPPSPTIAHQQRHRVNRVTDLALNHRDASLTNTKGSFYTNRSKNREDVSLTTESYSIATNRANSVKSDTPTSEFNNNKLEGTPHISNMVEIGNHDPDVLSPPTRRKSSPYPFDRTELPSQPSSATEQQQSSLSAYQTSRNTYSRYYCDHDNYCDRPRQQHYRGGYREGRGRGTEYHYRGRGGKSWRNYPNSRGYQPHLWYDQGNGVSSNAVDKNQRRPRPQQHEQLRDDVPQSLRSHISNINHDDVWIAPFDDDCQDHNRFSSQQHVLTHTSLNQETRTNLFFNILADDSRYLADLIPSEHPKQPLSVLGHRNAELLNFCPVPLYAIPSTCPKQRFCFCDFVVNPVTSFDCQVRES